MFFEDMQPGQQFETGSRLMSEEAIIAFARQWDPQPFHIDAQAAKLSPYGGLIASGWHTLLTAFTLTLEASDWSRASMGSPGMADVKWLQPVRPGDSLHVAATVVSARASRSKPDRGFVEVDYRIFANTTSLVASYRATHMLRLRAP